MKPQEMMERLGVFGVVVVWVSVALRAGGVQPGVWMLVEIGAGENRWPSGLATRFVRARWSWLACDDVQSWCMR